MKADRFVKAIMSKVPTIEALEPRAGWPFPVSIGYSVTTSTVSNVRITHCIASGGKGGVTIAWRKTSEMRNSRMVEVAVAYCSPADVFTKKIGTATALANFDAGMTVLVPARTDNDDLTIPSNLRNMFWYSVRNSVLF